VTTVLNEGLQFADLSQKDKRAFLRNPEKRLFDSRTRFYKLTGFPLLGHNGITPWWSFFERTRLSDGTIADGFQDSEEYARRLGKSHRDYQRVRSAVSHQFKNAMRDLLIIQLDTQAWGFAGVASGQREFADSEIAKDPSLANIYFIGGRVQAYIPNLTLTHAHKVTIPGLKVS
jgi:hypothetical protein